jgi:hypothetical protein
MTTGALDLIVDEFEDLFPGQRKGGSTLSVDGVEEMFAPRTPDAALSADGLSEFFEGIPAVPPEAAVRATMPPPQAESETAAGTDLDFAITTWVDTFVLDVAPKTPDLATVGRIAAPDAPLDAMVSSLAADLEKLAAEIAAFADDTV